MNYVTIRNITYSIPHCHKKTEVYIRQIYHGILKILFSKAFALYFIATHEFHNMKEKKCCVKF